MKKIFFIHIAKTAGSSFNAFLGEHFNGREHCEIYLESDGTTMKSIDYLQTLDYISGHFRMVVFTANNFSKEKYFLMTFLRDPLMQLLSHVNWVIHIYDRGSDFFKLHSKEIQSISLELRESNLHNPDIFIKTLTKFSSLFQDNQSRYFIDNAQVAGSQAIIEKMSILDMVGFTEFYEESLKTFIELNDLNISPKVHKINQNSSYKIGKEILENQLIYEFLNEYNKIDISVYNHFMSNSRELLFDKSHVA
jgi:hypothetical protein